MLFEFELDGTDDQTQRVILDNQSYELRFQWNYFMETWGVSIGEIGGEPFCYFTLTTYNDLTAAFRYDERVPQGTFFAGGYINSSTRIGRYNVGPSRECFLIYLSND